MVYKMCLNELVSSDRYTYQGWKNFYKIMLGTYFDCKPMQLITT